MDLKVISILLVLILVPLVSAERMTTSSVLVVNLTNALVLAGMKAIVIGAWILGKFSFWTYPGLGGWGPGFGRAHTSNASDSGAEEQINPWDWNADIRWTAAYFWSLNKQQWGCLFRMACENSKQAGVWLWVGKFCMSVKTYFFLPETSETIRFYQWLLEGFEEATNDGIKWAAAGDGQQLDQCSAKYSCKAFFALAYARR